MFMVNVCLYSDIRATPVQDRREPAVVRGQDARRHAGAPLRVQAAQPAQYGAQDSGVQKGRQIYNPLWRISHSTIRYGDASNLGVRTL